MPKDYQISQYDIPINVDGWLELPDGRRIGIVRAHMEEDTGKTTHVGGGGRIHEAAHSLVDYNRAGVPLVEIVSAPDLRSADEARAYVDELRAILVATGASDGKMEEGSLRVDANVSVRPAGSTEFGTRCEIKNLNSLRSLGRAIDYEAARQVAPASPTAGRVVQETRHWDEAAGPNRFDALQGRGLRLPVLPRARPGTGGPVGGMDRQRWPRRFPPLPAARRAAVAAASGWRRRRRGGHGGPPRPRPLRRRGGASPAATPALAVRRLANEVAAEIESVDRLDAGGVRAAGGDGGGRIAHHGPGPHRAQGAARVGRRPRRDRGRLGFEAMGAGDLAAVVDEVIGEHPRSGSATLAGEDKLTGFFIGHIKAATDGKADLKAASALLRARRA